MIKNDKKYVQEHKNFIYYSYNNNNNHHNNQP